MIVNTDSVNPTVAAAADPNLLTKKISTTANTDSMHISRIMGTANKKIALRKLPCVKSLPSLFNDSLNNKNKVRKRGPSDKVAIRIY
jgi:hypothetical protein